METQSASGIYGPDMTKKDQPKSPPVVEKIGKTPLSASPGTPHLQRVARRQIYWVFRDFSGEFRRFFGFNDDYPNWIKA